MNQNQQSIRFPDSSRYPATIEVCEVLNVAITDAEYKYVTLESMLKEDILSWILCRIPHFDRLYFRILSSASLLREAFLKDNFVPVVPNHPKK